MTRSATAHSGFSRPERATDEAQDITRYRAEAMVSTTEAPDETSTIEVNREFFETILRRRSSGGATMSSDELLARLAESEHVAR